MFRNSLSVVLFIYVVNRPGLYISRLLLEKQSLLSDKEKRKKNVLYILYAIELGLSRFAGCKQTDKTYTEIYSDCI